MEREATERHDAQARGLALLVKDFFFVASVYFLCDILPPLAQFSRAFQKTSIDFSMVKPLVQGTKDSIANLTKSHGEMFCKLNSDMEKLVASGFEELNEEQMCKFQQRVYNPYFQTISQHLESRFPDIALLEAFSIFDAEIMESQSEYELL